MPEPDYSALASPQASDRLAAVRVIKNSLIGSRTRKTLFIQVNKIIILTHSRSPFLSTSSSTIILLLLPFFTALKTKYEIARHL